MTAKCSQAHTGVMKAKDKAHVLTVREVPDAVYRMLRERAVINRRSLQQEVRRALEAEATRPAFDAGEFFRFCERFRGRFRPGQSLRMLRELRDR